MLKKTPNLLFFVCLLALFFLTGCPADGMSFSDDEQGPDGYPTLPGPPCAPGFIFDEVTASCDCPSPMVTLDSLLCTEKPAGIFYSTMEGCMIQPGAFIKIDSMMRFGEIEKKAGAGYIGGSNTDGRLSFFLNQRLRETENGLDSMSISFLNPPYLFYVEGQEFDFETIFMGVLVHPDTIRGHFAFMQPYHILTNLDSLYNVYPGEFIRQ